jgi:hypothetical protein
MYNVTEGFYASASNRTAGAIESIVWNYTEFVNQWDHGRELQLAVTNGSGECALIERLISNAHYSPFIWQATTPQFVVYS